MERRLREENVTLNIIKWLVDNKWEIITFDYPKSGTGIMLHANVENKTEKNKGGIIPDIIAVKGNCALFFENKDRFYEPDFDKLNEIKMESNYSDSLDQLLKGHTIKNIVYGIAIADVEKEVEKSKLHLEKIDFLISTNEKKEIIIHYDVNGIFSKSKNSGNWCN